MQQQLIRTQTERDERMTPEGLQILLSEIEDREREIASLRERADNLREDLSHSQETGITEKLRNKEQRLESFAQRCQLDWQIVRDLWGIYQQLIQARKNYNRNDIIEAQNSIEILKESIKTVIVLEDVHRIFNECEEIAELRVEQENLYQQQFEAHIQTPPHN